MSASGPHVVGLRPADDPTYVKMVGVVRACVAAQVMLPPQVSAYFRGELDGVRSDYVESLLDLPLRIEVPNRPWRDGMEEGIEIDVAAIPEGVATLRVWMSY